MISSKDWHLHFVGIGGIGMSGIAEVFYNQGFKVTGSDISDSDTVNRLKELGITIYQGHAAQNIAGANVVVISSAVQSSNPEVAEAVRVRVPVIRRAEMLGELMRGRTGVAVAGTHGKTTTTSMLATIMTSAGLDPTLVIGGKVDSFGGNAKLGQGEYLVAEADESDGSFIHLPLTYGIITNIDTDHMDHFGSVDQLDQAFLNFVGKVPFYGFVAVCGDDSGVKRCLSRMSKPVITYGGSDSFDYSYRDLSVHNGIQSFNVVKNLDQKPQNLGSFKLKSPGLHNVQNALACIVVADQLGVPAKKISLGLESFEGVRRRFEKKWESVDKKQIIIDDYGHHPTEIAATLNAAQSVWSGRILTVFQPHRYSRTRDCMDQFGSCFKVSDKTWITDIYPAGEQPISGVDANKVVSTISNAEYGGSIESVADKVLDEFKPGDMVICFGAGSITRLPQMMVDKMHD